MPKSKKDEIKLVRCNQMCEYMECLHHSPHEADDGCPTERQKCSVYPKARCIEIKGEIKPIIPKSERKKLKKVL